LHHRRKWRALPGFLANNQLFSSKGTVALILYGYFRCIQGVLAKRPEVFNHNVETVPRLYPAVRPSASYARSLGILGSAAAAGIQWVKSGLMVGLGESEAEVLAVLRDLQRHGANSLTIGQYLRPTKQHLPVIDYVEPDAFARLAEMARRIGIGQVVSGPLVRSSYRAGQVFVFGLGESG